MNRWRPLYALLMLAPVMSIEAQVSRFSVELTGGYAKIYDANGAEVQFAVMTQLGKSTAMEQGLGVDLVLMQSGFASGGASSRNGRHIIGGGAKYSVRFGSTHRVSPFLGVVARLIHASNSDIPTVADGGAQPTPFNPEDYPGKTASGWDTGFQGGSILRLGEDLSAIAMATFVHQELYAGSVRHAVWGLSLGFRVDLD